jgi:hypothetical protein
MTQNFTVNAVWHKTWHSHWVYDTKFTVNAVWGKLFNGAWPVYLVCVLLVSILWFTIQLSAIYTCTSADCIKLYIIHLNPMTINFCVTHSLTVAVKFCVIHLMTVKFCVILIDCINSVLYPCTQWLCLLPHTALTVNFVSYTQWLCQVLTHKIYRPGSIKQNA